jgi:hypothetical protein
MVRATVMAPAVVMRNMAGRMKEAGLFGRKERLPSSFVLRAHPGGLAGSQGAP